jgi:hypothetical protein
MSSRAPADRIAVGAGFVHGWAMHIGIGPGAMVAFVAS